MTAKDAEGDNPAIVAPSGAKFKIAGTKLYVPVVTLSKENDKKLLEQLKTGFHPTQDGLFRGCSWIGGGGWGGLGRP